MSRKRTARDPSAEATISNGKRKDEPFEDWIPEWWENGGKQWMAASINGRSPGHFPIWIQGWREGRAAGEQRAILRLGASRLGVPDDVTRSRIESIIDIDVLDRLSDRVQTVASCAAVLAEL